MSVQGRKQADQERRRYFRLIPEVDVKCSIEGTDYVHVLGLGATGAGMRVLTNHELPGERPFGVHLAVGSDEALQLQGRLVWHEVEDFDFCVRHVSGIEFVDLAEADRSRLAALLPPPDQRREASPGSPEQAG